MKVTFTGGWRFKTFTLKKVQHLPRVGDLIKSETAGVWEVKRVVFDYSEDEIFVELEPSKS